jgi:hypothetical protein
MVPAATAVRRSALQGETNLRLDTAAVSCAMGSVDTQDADEEGEGEWR